MSERLLTVKQVAEIYNVSEYQAQLLMIRAGRVNIGRGTDRPRWVAQASSIDAYLSKNVETVGSVRRKKRIIPGVDSNGKLIRR